MVRHAPGCDGDCLTDTADTALAMIREAVAAGKPVSPGERALIYSDGPASVIVDMLLTGDIPGVN